MLNPTREKLQHAKDLLARGHDVDAEQTLRLAVETDPSDKVAAVALDYMQRGDYQSVQRVLRDMLGP